IKFYPELCFSQQQQAICERKTQVVVGHAQAGGSEIAQERSNPCQFSTFKSSPGRAAQNLTSFDITELNVGCREKDIDREVVMHDSDTLELKNIISGYASSATKAAGSPNCFGSVDEEKGRDQENKDGSTHGSRRLTATRDACRHSGNADYLDKESFIHSDLCKKIFQGPAKQNKNFSFFLGMLKRNVDLSLMGSQSLDLTEEEWQKTASHDKHRSLDYSQKTEKSLDTSANKSVHRPNFVERVRRTWRFLVKQRLIRRRNKYEREQSAQEKCEYFLQKYQKDDFFDRVPSLPVRRASVESSHVFVSERDTSKDDLIFADQTQITGPLENSTFRAKNEENSLLNANDNALEKKPEVTFSNVEKKDSSDHFKDREINGNNNVKAIRTDMSNSGLSNTRDCMNFDTLKGILLDMFMCVCCI
ncbi:uncharacterized protein LOC143342782, partial [Colletes latitarsis]|uniref:uncharacterized protein LOC143342782 n=1 Tax=Colletes latitarsis TaxID=2605962 RepID=UPI004035CEA6